jgi:hypothetical protein
LAKSGDLSYQNMRRAVIYGSVMASFCVEEFGPERLLTLSREEIDARFEQFRALSHIP